MGFSGDSTTRFSGDSMTGSSGGTTSSFSGDATPGGPSAAVLHVRRRDSRPVGRTMCQLLFPWVFFFASVETLTWVNGVDQAHHTAVHPGDLIPRGCSAGSNQYLLCTSLDIRRTPFFNFSTV